MLLRLFCHFQTRKRQKIIIIIIIIEKDFRYFLTANSHHQNSSSKNGVKVKIEIHHRPIKEEMDYQYATYFVPLSSSSNQKERRKEEKVYYLNQIKAAGPKTLAITSS